jgi:hypothetical protein
MSDDMRPTLPEPPMSDEPLHSLPKCPDWCEGAHGNVDGGTDEQGITHSSRRCFSAFMPDIRNAVGGRMLRAGGHEVAVSLQQKDLWSARCGLTAVCLESSVLQLNDDNTITRGRVQVPLTSGEARTVAAALVRFADLADGLAGGTA